MRRVGSELTTHVHGTVRPMGNSVLLLCSCSNRKQSGGESAYRAENSVVEALGERGLDLLTARRQVLQHIRGEAKSIQGPALRDLPYNGKLVEGPDLGGTAAGLYMSAMLHYRGRFYQELDPGEAGTMDSSPHRCLIVSALYGLVAPKELIQRYSCHTLDDKEIVRTWSDRLLTSLLLHYVRVFDVRLIIDLLADASYRELFNWERIRRGPVPILRAFGEQNAGPGLLPALGFLTRRVLISQSAEDLLEINGARTYITDYEDVVLTS